MMPVYLWMVVALFAATVGLLGWWLRAAFHHEHAAPGTRAQAIFGAVMILVVIAVSVDIIYQHVVTSRKLQQQVDCNRRIVDAEQLISEQRKKVDEAAAMFDIAQHEWLIVSAMQSIVAADHPAYNRLQETLHQVTEARLQMMQVYADHPFVHC